MRHIEGSCAIPLIGPCLPYCTVEGSCAIPLMGPCLPHCTVGGSCAIPLIGPCLPHCTVGRSCTIPLIGPCLPHCTVGGSCAILITSAPPGLPPPLLGGHAGLRTEHHGRSQAHREDISGEPHLSTHN